MSQINLLSQVILGVGHYLENQISDQELSQITLSVISDDSFEELSDYVQGLIYDIDNKELNSLDQTDLVVLKEKLIYESKLIG